MANITIKGIPDDLYERLKGEARHNHRSLNSEIIHRLHISVGAPRVDAEEYLSELDDLQSGLSLPPLTDQLLRRARREGQP